MNYDNFRNFIQCGFIPKKYQVEDSEMIPLKLLAVDAGIIFHKVGISFLISETLGPSLANRSTCAVFTKAIRIKESKISKTVKKIMDDQSVFSYHTDSFAAEFMQILNGR
jgi:hypothetical protein